jgi:hypothetical protein
LKSHAFDRHFFVQVFFLVCCVDWGDSTDQEGNDLPDEQLTIPLKIGRWFTKLYQSIVPKFVREGLARAIHYLTEERNPMFQIFYVVIVMGSYITFIIYCFRFIPNTYLSEWHK